VHLECAPRRRGRWEAAHESRDRRNSKWQRCRDAKGWRGELEEMEVRREGQGSLCVFESTVQQLRDKLVFPGTQQEHVAQKIIMPGIHLSEVFLHTSLLYTVCALIALFKLVYSL